MIAAGIDQGTTSSKAAILTAEGARQAEILRAEGDKQAAVLRAQGEAEAIETVFNAIHVGGVDDKLLAYQYLQTLPKIADSASSKLWIVPSELTEALKGIGGAFAGGGTGSSSPAAPVMRRPRGSSEAAASAASASAEAEAAARAAAGLVGEASPGVVPPLPQTNATPPSATPPAAAPPAQPDGQ